MYVPESTLTDIPRLLYVFAIAPTTHWCTDSCRQTDFAADCFFFTTLAPLTLAELGFVFATVVARARVAQPRGPGLGSVPHSRMHARVV